MELRWMGQNNTGCLPLLFRGKKREVGGESCCEGTGEDAEIWDVGRYEGGDGRVAFHSWS